MSRMDRYKNIHKKQNLLKTIQSVSLEENEKKKVC